MVAISYESMIIGITAVWLLVRAFFWCKRKAVDWKRELQLVLVYICLIVVARFTFFPFGKVDGKIQPLLFDAARVFPFRINAIPLVNLMDYPELRDALLNLFGNTAMFVPIGMIWPIIYKELNTHKKVLTAGLCLSLTIEILQLPFYDRVTDIDDLILNTLGFAIGYGCYVLGKKAVGMIRKQESL